MNTKPEQVRQITSHHHFVLLTSEVEVHLRFAEDKFPLWPKDLLHGDAIINEEKGEATQAAIDNVWGRDLTLAKYRTELMQTAAMCIRQMAYIDQYCGYASTEDADASN